jgi:predicted dinucleotide-binding enzyme
METEKKRQKGWSRRQLIAGSMRGLGALFATGLPGRMAKAASSPMPLAVIGAGHIGSTVGGLWVKAGHPVMFATRHPEELTSLTASLGPLARAGSVPAALGFGEAVFLAIPYRAMPEFGQNFGPALRGRVVLDAGNAIAARDGASLAAEAEAVGIGRLSARFLPGARLVRAFNTLNYAILAREANRPPPRLAIPIAGDDEQALQVAQTLVRDAGFDPVVVGGLEQARLFQRGGPGYGQAVTADELRRILGLPPA